MLEAESKFAFHSTTGQGLATVDAAARFLSESEERIVALGQTLKFALMSPELLRPIGRSVLFLFWGIFECWGWGGWGGV